MSSNEGSVHARPERIPRWLVRSIGVMLLLVLGGVGLMRLNGFSPTVPPAPAQAERALAFADAPDGADRWDLRTNGVWLDVRSPGVRRGLRLGPRGTEPVDPTATDRWRETDLRHGLPRWSAGREHGWTPHMLSLDRLKAFSTRKGCYPGQ